MIDHIPFTEDHVFRVSTNLRVTSKSIVRPGRTITYADQEQMNMAVEEAMDIYHQLADKFSDQFHHNPGARRVCPNPACHHIYAFFYDDFLYCPQCGTKLIGKGPGMEEAE